MEFTSVGDACTYILISELFNDFLNELWTFKFFVIFHYSWLEIVICMFYCVVC